MLEINIDRTDPDAAMTRCILDGKEIADIFCFDPAKTDEEIRISVRQKLLDLGYALENPA